MTEAALIDAVLSQLAGNPQSALHVARILTMPTEAVYGALASLEAMGLAAVEVMDRTPQGEAVYGWVSRAYADRRAA